jgi:hypothetical protein
MHHRKRHFPLTDHKKEDVSAEKGFTNVGLKGGYMLLAFHVDWKIESTLARHRH